MFLIVKEDQGLVQGVSDSGFKSGIPLFVFFAEAYNNNICFLNQFSSSDTVQPCTLMVMPKAITFAAE